MKLPNNDTPPCGGYIESSHYEKKIQLSCREIEQFRYSIKVNQNHVSKRSINNSGYDNNS